MMKKRNFIFTYITALCAFTSCAAPEHLTDLSSQWAVEGNDSIHYKETGSGSEALVFVHGFGCNLDAWQKQYEEFRSEGNRMVFIDLPGHGLSSKPSADYTLQYYADAVKKVLDKEGIKRATLVGHSLGTPVCRQFVFCHPDMAKALCDVDGVYCLYPELTASSTKEEQEFADMYDSAVQQFAASFCGSECQNNIKRFVANLAGPATPKWVLDYAMGCMPTTMEHVACSTMSNLIERSWWTGKVIEIPTLVVCTKNSGLDPDNKQKMERLYSDMTYVELDSCGHFIMMEEAEMFNSRLRTLLGK